MWKEYLYFSGSQRAGIWLLLCLILLTGIINALLPRIIVGPEDDDEVAARFQEEVILFQAALHMADSLRIANRSSARTAAQFSQASKSAAPEHFPFDPNLLDSAGFRRLGLPAHMASNIVKYRSRGGVFRDAASFSKVYGLSEQQYAQLLPWIVISPLSPSADISQITPQVAVESKKSDVNEQQDVLDISSQYCGLVELNSADTTQLMSVKGIGSGFANAIIRYRNDSGGYVDVKQLMELPRMTPEYFERIAPFCRVDTSLVLRINVNTATVDRLRRHPYINFYQARQIFELRRRNGRLMAVDELAKLSEIDSVTLVKISPYLRFN